MKFYSFLQGLLKAGKPYFLRFPQILKSFLTWKGNPYYEWSLRDYQSPSPHFIKQLQIFNNAIPDGIWIETGTYLGETTEFLRSKGFKVYTIEPKQEFFEKAKNKFENFNEVIVLKGLSEQVLPELLPRLQGNINFWLDGHYSGGNTFKGPLDTPILKELDALRKNLNNFKNICVMIDDVRMFNPNIHSEYPSIDVIVDWARQNSFLWKIEHDIFIAKRLDYSVS